MTALVWLLLGIALSLPAAVHLLTDNLAVLGERLRVAPAVSVFFAADLPAAAVAELLADLRATAGVADVEHVTPAQGLATLGIDAADHSVTKNPLPSVALLRLHDATGVEPLAAVLRRLPGVDQVIAEHGWLVRLEAIEAVLAAFGAILGLVLLLASVGLAGASVRLALDDSIDQVRVAMLVGATDAQVRRPFLYLGAAYGVGGALLCVLLIAASLVVLAAPVAALGAAYGSDISIGLPPLRLIVALLAGGLLLGLVGALLGVHGAWRRVALR